MTPWLTHAVGAGPYRDWLTRTGSLTRALQARCPAFHVWRVRQELDRPFPDEFAALGLPHGQPSIVREVILNCGQRPLVFAHTVLPCAGMRGPWQALAYLGNRPLGAALFADPRIERYPLQFRRLNRHHPLHLAAARAAGPVPDMLWGRRSLFALQGRPILVTEVFLPEMLRL
jgi:chorismate--pyruvate lyase